MAAPLKRHPWKGTLYSRRFEVVIRLADDSHDAVAPSSYQLTKALACGATTVTFDLTGVDEARLADAEVDEMVERAEKASAEVRVIAGRLGTAVDTGIWPRTRPQQRREARREASGAAENHATCYSMRTTPAHGSRRPTEAEF